MASGSAPLEARRFRDTIGLFVTGVAIIVGCAADEVLAMTVNAVSSVSLDPMLMLFCPAKKSRVAQRLTSLSGFSINILRHEQQALSTYFAGAWREPAPPPFRFVPSRPRPISRPGRTSPRTSITTPEESFNRRCCRRRCRRIRTASVR